MVSPARAVLLVFGVASVCGQTILESPAFKNLERMPDRFCCDVVERDPYRPSVPLAWLRPPAQAQSFVLIMDEMESELVYWAVKDIPRGVLSLDEDVSEVAMPTGSVELPNSFGTQAYSAPCPETSEQKHYRFRLFAMPTVHTNLKPSLNATGLRSPDYISQIEKDALYVSLFVGNYSFTEAELIMAYGIRHKALKPSFPDKFPWDEPHNYKYRGHRHRRGAHHLNETAGDEWSDDEAVNTTLPRKALHFLRVPIDDGPPGPEERVKRPRVQSRRANITRLDDLPVNRFVKPSEAFHQVLKHLDGCQGSTQEQLDECLALQMDAERVWSCGSRSQSGMRFTPDGQTERCTLRVRFADVPCEKQTYPRQCICASSPSDTLAESPGLEWIGAPNNTHSFVVTLEDSSPSPRFAGEKGQLHWIVANIPYSESRLDTGASGHLMPALSVELKNAFHFPGYTAPCPGQSDERMFTARVYAMPHPTTMLFLSGQPRSAEVQTQLRRLALCAATTELPFSFATAAVHKSRRQHVIENHSSEAHTRVVQPGEVELQED